MNEIQNTLEHASAALGVAVLHSLWQCALIGALATLVLMLVRRASVRYMVWCGALFVCAAWMLVTFASVMWPSGSGSVAIGDVGGFGAAPFEMMMSEAGTGSVFFEIIAWLWAGGFVFFTLRFTHQWANARRLRTQGIIDIERHWLSMFEEVRAGLGVSRRVRMLVSLNAKTPMVVGWLSPVVIVPTSALTMLSPEQVRLVLVHELAHIRRFDHLVNALQVLIETVLFYHPVVWWMSHQARMEREHCCDDAAVRWGGDAVLFARALTELETTRTHSRAVLALNHGGSLMNRITRILGTTNQARLGGKPVRTLAALTAGMVVAAAGIANAALRVEEPRDDQVEVIRNGVDSGVMTHEQARMIYDTVVYPGSDAQLKMEIEFDRIQVEIEAAVAAGKITQEEAQRKLDEIDRGFDERVSYHFMMNVLGMSKGEARLSMLREELAGLVEDGLLSREEAEAKYHAAQWEIDGHDRVRLYLDRLETEIRAAVESGEITGEEGRIKLESARRKAAIHMKKMAIEAEIEAGVESGEMTRDEADAKYEELRREDEKYLLPTVIGVVNLPRDLEVENGTVDVLPNRVKIVNTIDAIVAETQYTVVVGDTLAEISTDLYGTADRAGEIAELNGIEDASGLKVGQVLRVIEGQLLPAPVAEIDVQVIRAQDLYELERESNDLLLPPADGDEWLPAPEAVIDLYIERDVAEDLLLPPANDDAFLTATNVLRERLPAGLEVRLSPVQTTGIVLNGEEVVEQEEIRIQVELIETAEEADAFLNEAAVVDDLWIVGECEQPLNSLFQALTDAERVAEIKEALVAGEITREEADAALQRNRAEQVVVVGENANAHINHIELQVRELVETGEITAEQGRARIEEARRSIELRMKWAYMESSISESVNAGTLTREAAQAKLGELRNERQAAVTREWEAVRSHIEAAVKAGTMTREDAKRAYEFARDRLFPSQIERKDDLLGQNDSSVTGVNAEGNGWTYIGGVVPLDASDELSAEEKAERYEAARRLYYLQMLEMDNVKLTDDAEAEEKKLNPGDEEYWLYQGIRPLDAYEEEDGC